MSSAGWYPDPGGQSGMYRYWTGTSWSAAITNNPMQAAPPGGIGVPQRPTASPQWQPGTGQKRQLGWWIGAVALLLAVIVAAWFAVRGLGDYFGTANPTPGSNPTDSVCPRKLPTTDTPAPHPDDGRVHGGQLSFPMLGAPWQAPESDDRVPFGRDVQVQSVMVESNYQPGKAWVASVLVGELVAGDGFFSPQQGSEIVVKCIMGVFYDDAEVIRDDRINQATTVGGRDAWLVETHLSFDIQGLRTKGELAIILIVATSDASSSIFYASIPDTSPEYVEPARQAMAQLKVGP